MRARLLCLPLLTLSFVVLAASAPTGFGQGRGGFGKGGFGGFGSGGDPSAMFDRLAKGRGYFLISEVWMMRKPLQDYAQEKGISNGQITREQYLAFDHQLKAK